MIKGNNYSIILILLFEMVICLIVGSIISVSMLAILNNTLGVHTAIMVSVFFGIPTGSIIGIIFKRLLFKEDVNIGYLLILFIFNFSCLFILKILDSVTNKNLITYKNEKIFILSTLIIEYMIPVIYDFYCMKKKKTEQ